MTMASCGTTTIPPNVITPMVKGAVVYSMSNGSSGNAILAFMSAADGTLQAAGIFETGGKGTGASIENQGALSLTEDRQFLLVVNPATDDFSLFRLAGSGPQLLSTTPSRGRHPVSISTRRGLVYVLNSGGSSGTTDSIAGFRLSAEGALQPIPGSTLSLSSATTNPAQIQISPNADLMVVTERRTNLVDVYTLDADGVPTGPIVNASAGLVPFGFSFGTANRIFVSEAGTGSASSYDIPSDGHLQTISPAVQNGQRAACWLALTPNGKFAYTANTGSSSITGYRINSDGSLQLINSDGKTAEVTNLPFDIAVSPDGEFLYVLTGRQNIETLQIDPSTGDLTAAHKLAGLPPGSNGLVSN
jgi:6-phosphogluconolactonase